MIFLYWQIGRSILERQREEGWGAKVIEQLSKDLHREFPDLKGFSRSNLMYLTLSALKRLRFCGQRRLLPKPNSRCGRQTPPTQ
uniref:DUF1016 N-terminal domain-containing protein n=1 Tax=Microseira wollei TaxID=467598 RepID=UPI001CFEA9D5|nr:DUF1016 N-terminal domain-containing protein [Microseira wollei]